MVTFIYLSNTTNKKTVFNKSGYYVVFIYNLSGEFIFDINASNVHLDIFGLFIGKKDQNFSISTVQRHMQPSSFSNLLIRGIFYDSSKFHYKGLIRIEKNAIKSHAYQKNQNLILSKEAFVESKPYLEILNNDVFCTHGSTIGRINEDNLFYIQSKGLDKQKAIQTVVDGFIEEIVGTIRQKVPEFSFPLDKIC